MKKLKILITTISKFIILKQLIHFYKRKNIQHKYLVSREWFYQNQNNQSSIKINDSLIIPKYISTLCVYYDYSESWEGHSFRQSLSIFGLYDELHVPYYPKNSKERIDVSNYLFNNILKKFEKQSYHWVILYINGWMILTKHLVELRKQLGVPFILISFDDKHNFFDKKISGQYTGTFDLCKHVDLFWTSSEITSSWAKSIGSKAVFIAEGANPEVYFPINCEKIYDVSFVGLNYGVREQFIKKLSKYNLRISCFGNNWNSSNSKYLSNSDINGIFNQSKINLGIGFASASNIITNLKGRDFEIPMAGGGIYLTSYNYDLAKFYNLNNEILCYNGIEDCVELIRFLLNNQSLREEISYNAYNRAYSQHKWEDRFCSAYNYIIAQAH